jgi:large subunit ribosomal protein L10
MKDEAKKVQQANLDAVADVKKKLEAGREFVFADYRGLSVEQITDLRKKLRASQAEFKVVKNRFAKIAFKDLQYPDVSDYLKGPTAVAIAKGEASEAIKILFDEAKEKPLQIKGGIIEKRVFNREQVEAFSRLPSRQQLIAMLMGTMNAPVQNFVFALNGVTSKLVRTLQAVADKKSNN